MPCPRPTRAIFALLLGLAVLTGCGRERAPGSLYPAADTSFQVSAAERDSALAVLERLDQEAMRGASARLSAYRFTRHTRTEQFEADTVAAFRERTVRYRTDRPPELLAEETGGTFDFGLLARLAPTDAAPQEAPRDAAAHLLPEDPPYLAPRSREAYWYRLLPDTLLWERPVQVAEVGVRPEAEDGQSIRRARFYIDRATQALIAFALERADHTLLFRESSRSFIALRPAPDAGWVPHTVRVQTHIALPLRAPQHLRTASTYYDYEAVL